ncbi:MAG TPA: hypothetical protein PKW23_04505 [Dictyoglomaceae bacterium]|nr:hypothetical protein [Dictyoglomaceae bacterium]HOL39766.1 hypothetical protein [Dictyoglomaceae bacterium]HPP16254.1 hypothetical protein [Dictyoglomaceae bacterium]HPU43458.1 hypothetical protein [Dictyoglomaceae bacterium]
MDREINLKELERKVRKIVKRLNIEDIVRKAIEHFDPPTLNGIVALDLKTGEIFSYSSLEEPSFSKTIVVLYYLPVSEFPLEKLFSEKELNTAKILMGDGWNLSARDIANTLGKECKDLEDYIFSNIMRDDSPEEEIVKNIMNYVKKVVSSKKD